MELISVRGSIEDINNYANLYQKFSSIGSKTVDLARKQFMDSELSRYIKGPEVVSFPHTSVQEVEEEATTIEYVGHGVMLDEVQDGVVEQDMGNKVIKEYVTHGVMLDEEAIIDDTEGKVPPVETYTSHGVMLDEIIYDAEDSRVDLTDSEYDVTNSFEDESISPWDSEEGSEEGWDDDEESSWGLDDTEDGEVAVDNEGDGLLWDTEEEPESEWGSDDNSEEPEWGSEGNDNQEWSFEPEEVANAARQEEVVPTLGESVEISVERERIIPEKGVESKRKTPRFEQQRTLPEPKPFIKRVTENTVPSMDKTVIPTVSYANVRAYVKGNPGCTSAEVAKYFPASEIKKALMSSKVVEKKGKLYAV